MWVVDYKSIDAERKGPFWNAEWYNNNWTPTTLLKYQDGSHDSSALA
jgi:hypothetical protein